MSMINAVSPATGARATTRTSATSGLDSDAFLKVLVEQLRQQDPTSPSDPGQFVAQISSLTQVEQTVQANAKLDGIRAAVGMSGGAAMIGHSVSSADGLVSGIVHSINNTTSGLMLDLGNGRQLALSDVAHMT